MEKIKLFRECPICKNSEGVILGHLNFAVWQGWNLPHNFEIVECNRCNHVFYNLNCSRKHLDDFYINYYFTSRDIIDNINYVSIVHRNDNPYELIKPYLESHSVSICDIGCGKGLLFDLFIDNNYRRLFGIEPSSICIDYINKNCPEINAKKGGIYNIPFREKFDVIMCIHVFEHLWNIEEAVKNIYNHLNDNGIVYVEVPDLQKYELCGTPMELLTYEHINHFTTKDLFTSFIENNFTILKYGDSTVDYQPIYPSTYIIAQKNSTQNENIPLEKNNFNTENVSKWTKDNNFSLNSMCSKISLEKTPVYIWGISLKMHLLLGMSDLKKCNIVGLIDNDKRKQGRIINNIKISPPSILKNAANNSTVLVWGKGYFNEIEKEARTLGFTGKIIQL